MAGRDAPRTITITRQGVYLSSWYVHAHDAGAAGGENGRLLASTLAAWLIERSPALKIHGRGIQ